MSESKDELHLALDVPERVRKRIAEWVATLDLPPDAELLDPGEYHITMAYAPHGVEDETLHHATKLFNFTGLKFDGKALTKLGPAGALVVELSCPGFDGYAEHLNEWLEDQGAEVSHYDDGYKPHITLAYMDEDAPPAKLPPLSFRCGPMSFSTPRGADQSLPPWYAALLPSRHFAGVKPNRPVKHSQETHFEASHVKCASETRLASVVQVPTTTYANPPQDRFPMIYDEDSDIAYVGATDCYHNDLMRAMREQGIERGDTHQGAWIPHRSGTAPSVRLFKSDYDKNVLDLEKHLANKFTEWHGSPVKAMSLEYGRGDWTTSSLDEPGYFYHVAPAYARESIQANGLNHELREKSPWSDLNQQRNGFPAGQFLFEHDPLAREYAAVLADKVIYANRQQPMTEDHFLSDHHLATDEQGQPWITHIGDDDEVHERPYDDHVDRHSLPPHLQGYDVWRVKMPSSHVLPDPEPLWSSVIVGGNKKRVFHPEKQIDNHEDALAKAALSDEYNNTSARWYTPHPVHPDNLELWEHIPLISLIAGQEKPNTEFDREKLLEDASEYYVPDAFQRLRTRKEYEKAMARIHELW